MGSKSEWARLTWEYVAPIHIRGHCPHPSNHLRRRIHQPSLLPHNIHRNMYAVQESYSCENGSCRFAENLIILRKMKKNATLALSEKSVIVATTASKNCTIRRAKINLNFLESQQPIELRNLQFAVDSRLRSSHVPGIRSRSNATANDRARLVRFRSLSPLY